MKIQTNNKGRFALSLALLLTVVSALPFYVKAGVEDESTYNSWVTGTNQTYYRTIATNYHAGSIVGMVSKTSAADMETAVRITVDDKKLGYEPVLFINDMDWKSDERKLAEQTAKELNGTLVAMLDVQLFRYEVSAFAPVHDTAIPVTMIAGIPESSQKDGNKYTVLTDYREYAMVRVHNGEVTVLKDLDDDLRTLTFETDKFSAFGLIYTPIGEVDKYLGNQTNAVPEAAPASTPAAENDNSELDDVPKTGDILWEIEYGYYK